MSDSSLYSQLGRVRRAQRSDLYLFAFLSLILAVGAGYLWFNYYTHPNLSPLQRVYYYQFRHSFAGNFYLFEKAGSYQTFTRTVTDPKTKKPEILWVTEDQMTPKLDDEGLVEFKNNIPQFYLNNNIEVDQKGFVLRESTLPHKNVYEFFKQRIYGSSYPELFYMPAVVGCFIFGLSMFGTYKARDKFIMKNLHGAYVRGTLIMSPKEYSKKWKDADGIGIFARSFEVKE